MTAPTSYDYVCRAFWADHVDDDPLSEEDLIDMAEELDAMAQDAASYWIEHRKAPWLTGEENEQLIAAAPALLAALQALLHQARQMFRTFPDKDGTIEAAIQTAEDAINQTRPPL